MRGWKFESPSVPKNACRTICVSEIKVQHQSNNEHLGSAIAVTGRWCDANSPATSKDKRSRKAQEEKDLKRRREGDEATRQPRPPRRRSPFIWVRNYAGGDVFQVAPLAMNVKKGDQGEAEQRLYG
jgi:hypothetical protein